MVCYGEGRVTTPNDAARPLESRAAEVKKGRLALVDPIRSSTCEVRGVGKGAQSGPRLSRRKTADHGRDAAFGGAIFVVRFCCPLTGGHCASRPLPPYRVPRSLLRLDQSTRQFSLRSSGLHRESCRAARPRAGS